MSSHPLNYPTLRTYEQERSQIAHKTEKGVMYVGGNARSVSQRTADPMMSNLGEVISFRGDAWICAALAVLEKILKVSMLD